MQIRIQYASTGLGLVKDAQILADILRAQGVDVTIDALTPRPLPPERLAARLNRLLCRLNARRLEQCFTHIEQRFIPQDAVPHVDINIHLETVFRSRLARANRNILIPNQEWFRPEWRRVLCLLDDVACKTHLAMDVFGRIAPANVRVEYMGFTSPTPDCIEARVKDECLHLAGRSPLKGTAAVIEAWARHPEWPTLNVLGEGVVGPTGHNIRYHSQVDDKALAEIRGRCWLVVAPSEVEGFGHSLVENMALGRVVLTTEAPPMNELIQPDRGLLVPGAAQRRHRLGTCYQVDVNALETVLINAFAMSDAERRRLQASAQDWYADQHSKLVTRLMVYLGITGI